MKTINGPRTPKNDISAMNSKPRSNIPQRDQCSHKPKAITMIKRINGRI
jgi:hypothetical protein